MLSDCKLSTVCVTVYEISGLLLTMILKKELSIERIWIVFYVGKREEWRVAGGSCRSSHTSEGYRVGPRSAGQVTGMAVARWKDDSDEAESIESSTSTSTPVVFGDERQSSHLRIENSTIYVAITLLRTLPQ